MCGGNRASSAAYYINKQFESLWEIANQCVQKHPLGYKPAKADVEYGTCLAQFCVGKHNRSKPCTEDLDFFTAFGAPPKLSFICNHEVVLQLQLKAGHYTLQGKGSLNRFEDYTCSFRVQFSEHLITDTSYYTSGQTEVCKAKLLILDLTTATFIRELSFLSNGSKLCAEDVDRHHKSIVKYLSTYYLPFLRKAGFHSIYSLPDFDCSSRTHHIDYSVISEIDIESFELFGINTEAINVYMTNRWLEAASCVDDLEDDHDHSLFGQFALAEHRGICEDVNFHAYFGPPRIRPLCSKEVLFYINVQQLDFCLDGGFDDVTHSVSDWTIVVIVEVNFVEEEEGCVRRLKLDFTRARFCESRSEFGCETIEESVLIKLKTTFIQYIMQRYLFILNEYNHHHIYRIDVRVVEIEEDYSEEEEIIEFTSEFRERLCITDTFGFDVVTTVSQGSVNDHLRCLWKAAQSQSCLGQWSLDESFKAEFGALQVQFPSDSCSNTVIVYVTLREGFLTALGRGKKITSGNKHDFINIKLAFEVCLKLRDYTERHAISDWRFEECGDVGEFVLKQLVLDLTTARFRQDLSRLSGLFDGCHHGLVRSKREALLFYITRHYFSRLEKENINVLYSFPIWKQGNSCESIRYAPCSFMYQFLPSPCGEEGKYISGLFGNDRNFGNRNMLVILGMVDQTKRPGFPLPPCSWRWSSCEKMFSGMFSLSRSIFLEGWLLKELMRINGRTTLVPVFHGIGDAGAWEITFVKWEEHGRNRDQSCGWKEIGQCEGGLEFEWQNKDEWTYAHLGDACDIYNGGYSVSCKTRNTLIIPTSTRHGVCEIKIAGRVDLKLYFSGKERNWSTQAYASWSATIRLAMDSYGGGLKVTSSESNDISHFSGFSGCFDMVHPKFKDASTILREHFSDMVFVEEQISQELESTFSGVWPLFYSGAYGYTLGNPMFNSCGDLLFEMVPPIDRHGHISVSGTRPDICLPTGSIKHHHRHTRETLESETSILTTSTGIDSPPHTPPLGRQESKVHIRGDSGDNAGIRFHQEDLKTVHHASSEVGVRRVESHVSGVQGRIFSRDY